MPSPDVPRRPSVLFLTVELPYPPQAGGRIKSWKLVEHLSRRYALTVACPLKRDDARHVDAMRARAPLADFVAEPQDVPRSARALARSYVAGVPLNVLRARSPTLARRIAAIAPRHALIVSDHYEVFQYIPATYTGPVVLHAHNAYFMMWQRYAETAASPALRLAAWLEARRVKHYELAACARATRVIAAPNDVATLTAQGADPAMFGVTYHLGDDAACDRPPLDRATTELALLYVGTLTWEPNVDGLSWFLDAVWPLLVARHPTLRLRIAGRGDDPRLRAVAARDPRVELLGFVDDLEPLFARSRVLVAPIRVGAGIKVKVLTGLARGIPTVTTTMGAEGVELVSGRHLALADTPAEQVAAIDALLTDEATWTRLSREGRAHVEARYTWPRVVGAFEGELEALLAEPSPGTR